MKWPKKVKYRNKVLARVYRPCGGKEFYRVAWHVAGQRMMKSFARYSGPGGAMEYAEKKVRELADNSQAALLTPAMATDALAAIERLNSFKESTGKRVSLLAAVSEYCATEKQLHGRSLSEVVEGFDRAMGTVKRKDIGEAIEEFIAGEEPSTKSADGQRAQRSAKYHYNRAILLRRFAGAFPSMCACDLGKEHLDTFFSSNQIATLSTKSRRHHLAAVLQFFSWCVRKDYLPATHRLNQADSVVRLKRENANTSEVACYTAKEFRALLETAGGPLRAMVAIGGLAGLRTEELLRLDWSDVWGVRGHVTVTAQKSKTRSRRLVEICPALADWLKLFRDFKTGPLWTDTESIFQKAIGELCHKADVARKPNALRHSFCSYGYMRKGEIWTAQQAGNSPKIVISNYRQLATKQQAAAWFAVRPSGKTITPTPKETAA